MNEKVNKWPTITIISLIIVILGLTGYIVYDKINENNQNNINENNPNNNGDSNITNKVEYDFSEIDKLLNDNLSNYINFRVNTNGTDLLKTSEGRLELVNSILMELKLCNWYNDNVTQTIPYVSYDIYKEKYNELFGNLCNLEQDLKTVSSDIANNCNNISLSGNNICWNGTWGATVNNIVLKSKDVSKIDNDSYKITGTYVNNFNTENGTFEVQYIKTENDKYLTSLKLIKN